MCLPQHCLERLCQLFPPQLPTASAAHRWHSLPVTSSYHSRQASLISTACPPLTRTSSTSSPSRGPERWAPALHPPPCTATLQPPPPPPPMLPACSFTSGKRRLEIRHITKGQVFCCWLRSFWVCPLLLEVLEHGGHLMLSVQCSCGTFRGAPSGHLCTACSPHGCCALTNLFHPRGSPSSGTAPAVLHCLALPCSCFSA